MSLAERLARAIACEGSISVAAYMNACLHDPAEGYYAARPRLGADGDFITAPHVSQMFGEILGAWTAQVWRSLGAPARLRLIELGPGDGTLIGDVWRAARVAPGLAAALDIALVETSAPLRALQAKAVAAAGMDATWWRDLAPLAGEHAPVVVLGNEFLDCLPARQWVRLESGWAERRIGLGAGGALSFVLAPLPAGADPGPAARGALPGAVLETCAAAADLGREVGAAIMRAGGAALFIDYGAAGHDGSDTLQAICRARREGPLSHPGEADLTCHADFAALMQGARSAGACAPAPITQRDFLRALGIEARAAALAGAHPARAAVIGRQLRRLVGADQMGDLFKVACLHAPGAAPPPF